MEEDDFNTTLSLTSPNFGNDSELPKQFSNQGHNVNPTLKISNVPNGTKKLILLFDSIEEDALSKSHWVLYDIDPETRVIEQGFIPKGSKLGINSFNEKKYHGPEIGPHKKQYFFKLYAVDQEISFDENTTKEDIELEIGGCILDSTNLICWY